MDPEYEAIVLFTSGRQHARPPYRAEVLTLDPLPHLSALARSEHSPTLRERVVRSIAVMASAWREVRARAWQHAIRGLKVPGTSVLVFLRYVCAHARTSDQNRQNTVTE